MKFLFVCVTIIAAAYAATGGDECYKDSVRACKSTLKDKKDKKDPSLPSCSAKYGAIQEVLPDLQQYVNSHITRNFEYMLMATHYGNYEKSRAGFEKLFMDLSDSKWEATIDLIKYITKRGGEMKFDNIKADTVNDENASYELYELNSLAKALDMEKELAERAHHIHGEATRRRESLHDPEVSSYIENEFVHKHAATIRKLSGYTSDLTSLLNGPDSSLALYIFDDYLKKQSIV
ncbi:hypothetical protein PPYR_15518 [Photinus pyralis]|uniref:Ferritin n=1 Tax=Photinus pyralis TaxID=7054 RepID=A0A1Y1JX64_PHOPY|nr:soma ferritin-like [Photinus pyralis]KAB0790153.1 hypothetical protein PPYR_15518 [Photinus pyralis]